MRRRLFSFASIISLLLCAVSVALWIRSSRVTDMISFSGPRFSGSAFSSQGAVLCFVKGLPAHSQPVRGWRHMTSGPTSLKDFVFGYMSFTFRPHGFGGIYLISSGQDWGLMLADWALACATAVLPACWLFPFVRRRSRRARGQCLSCGYDLTANASGVCPECGMPFDAGGPGNPKEHTREISPPR